MNTNFKPLPEDEDLSIPDMLLIINENLGRMYETIDSIQIDGFASVVCLMLESSDAKIRERGQLLKLAAFSNITFPPASSSVSQGEQGEKPAA